MKNKRFMGFLMTVALLVPVKVVAQRDVKYLREGNKAFEKKQYDQAELAYRKAREEAKDPVKPDFNLGDALYKQKKYNKAATNFLSVAGKTNENIKKADAFYNLGNTMIQTGKIDESIEAYKNALRLNPGDRDAKYNLSCALRLKKQQQQQKQQQKQDKNQNQQDKQQQNKQNQQKNQQDQQNQQNQQKKQQQNQQDKNRQQMQPSEGKISKETAERLLQALANDEKKVQEKVKKAKAQAHKTKTVINW